MLLRAVCFDVEPLLTSRSRDRVRQRRRSRDESFFFASESCTAARRMALLYCVQRAGDEALLTENLLVKIVLRLAS